MYTPLITQYYPETKLATGQRAEVRLSGGVAVERREKEETASIPIARCGGYGGGSALCSEFCAQPSPAPGDKGKV